MASFRKIEQHFHTMPDFTAIKPSEEDIRQVKATLKKEAISTMSGGKLAITAAIVAGVGGLSYAAYKMAGKKAPEPSWQDKLSSEHAASTSSAPAR